MAFEDFISLWPFQEHKSNVKFDFLINTGNPGSSKKTNSCWGEVKYELSWFLVVSAYFNACFVLFLLHECLGVFHLLSLIFTSKYPKSTVDYKKRPVQHSWLLLFCLFCLILSHLYFTHPHFILNLYDFLSSVGHKSRYFEKCWIVLSI